MKMRCALFVDQPPERIWRFKLKRHKHSHHLLAMVSDSQKREEMLSRLFSKALPAKQPKLFGFIVLKIHKQQPKSNLKTMPPRAWARAGLGGGGGDKPPGRSQGRHGCKLVCGVAGGSSARMGSDVRPHAGHADMAPHNARVHARRGNFAKFPGKINFETDGATICPSTHFS